MDVEARFNCEEESLTVGTVTECHASAKRRVCRERPGDAALRERMTGRSLSGEEDLSSSFEPGLRKGSPAWFLLF